MIRRFQQAVARALAAAGVRPGDAIVVACSHGPDSLALADVLAARPGVTLVYADHGLRAESAAEGEAVRAFAASRGIPARVVRITIRKGRGPEEAARAARYAALDSVADEVGARWIAFGHTASDQAETVILRLIRGAGVVGLAGIPAVRGRYVRPLLGVTRADVLAYLAARDLTPSHDASNASPAFQRNRVRHTVLPALRAENPAADAALARAAEALRETADALDWAATEAARAVVRATPGGVRMDAEGLARLPAAVAKRLLTRAAADLGIGLESRHLAALLALAAAPSAGSKQLHLPRGSARREYGALLLEPAASEGILSAMRQVSVQVSGSDGPYRVRGWLPGDRMRPAALKGRSRKLQDLFTDRKVPRDARRQAVVVVRESDGTIVWSEHIGPAYAIPVEVTLTEIRPEANT